MAEELTALPAVEELRRLNDFLASADAQTIIHAAATSNNDDLKTIIHYLAALLRRTSPNQGATKMAVMMTMGPAGSPNAATFDLTDLKASVDALNLDWNVIWADIQKYGPGFVALALAVATDIAAGNWAKIFSDLWTMGPAEIVALLAILKDLGVTLPFSPAPA